MGSHIGLWDKFFGKRLTLELPQPDGTTVRVQVTAKWLREMERQGNIQRNETAAAPATVSPRELEVHEGAALLVPGARIFAASFYSDLTRIAPEVRQLFGLGARELEVWDCLLAVAAVGVAYEALVRANSGMQPQVERIIDPAAREVHPDGVEILRNCETFVQQGRFITGLYETVVGAWVRLIARVDARHGYRWLRTQGRQQRPCGSAAIFHSPALLRRQLRTPAGTSRRR